MNREIKFRAWDKEAEQMVYSDERDKKDRECDYSFKITSKTVKCYFSCDYDDSMRYPTQTGGELDNIMQCTGIADRKCTEIYEGEYRNKETGEIFTYLEMLKEWREKYEGIEPETGFYLYNWHTRYDYIKK